jgi:hypothetical protein
MIESSVVVVGSSGESGAGVEIVEGFLVGKGGCAQPGG